MSTQSFVSESRGVGSFDRVRLDDYGQLFLSQGERESLVIEADPAMMPKLKSEVRDGTLVLGIGGSWWNKLDLSTSLNRRVIRYRLTVRKLVGLDIYGIANVTAAALGTDRLALTLSGGGQVSIESLSARLLDVDLRGTGWITLKGQVEEQKVALRGAGEYKAPGLRSKKADVSLTGTGRGTIWVEEELRVTIGGIGSLSYYGKPVVTQTISGLGRVVSLGRSPT